MNSSRWVAAVVGVALSLPAPLMAADPAPVAAPAPATPAVRAEILRTAEAKLSAGDAESLRQAFATLAELGGDPASEAIAKRLRRGLPPALIDTAIDTLVLIGRPNAVPALLELTLHRRAPIREHAVRALGALKASSAQSALLFALDDPSPEVRVAAVQGLGELGNSRALPALFTAFTRGLDKAMTSVGEVAAPADLKAVFAHAQASDVTVIKPALQVLMHREKFSSSAKLQVIQMLTKLGSASARTCLVQWLDEWKTTGDPQLRKALFASISKLDHDAAKATPAGLTPAQPAPARPAPAQPAPAPSAKAVSKAPVVVKPAQSAKVAAKTGAP